MRLAGTWLHQFRRCILPRIRSFGMLDGLRLPTEEDLAQRARVKTMDGELGTLELGGRERLLEEAHNRSSNPPAKDICKQLLQPTAQAKRPKPRCKASSEFAHGQEAYERAFRPYPLFPDLPYGPARLSAPNGRTEDGSVVFERLDPAHNFVSLYCTRFKGAASLKTYRWNQYSLQTRQIERVRVAVVLGLDPQGQSEAFAEVHKAIGVGEGKSLADARKAARMDLAERLYRVLDDPRALTHTKGVDTTFEDTYVRIKLKGQTKDLMRQAFTTINSTSAFVLSSLPESADATNGGNGVGSRNRNGLDSSPRLRTAFERQGEAAINALPLPKRLEGHPLPVAQHYHRILGVIDAHQVTVVTAATGSGKTTQLPQFLLEHYRAQAEAGGGMAKPHIVVTQPRRIAAKSVAKRIAEERGERMEGGRSAVGYSVRFDSVYPRLTADGSILFCTSGILLRRLQVEPELTRFTHIILDEVHERDVYTDILLLMIRRLLRRRTDLRLILMSATMQSERIAAYFREAGFSVGSTLDIRGTNYPVAEHYLEDIVKTLPQSYVGRLSENSKEYVRSELAMVPVDHSAPHDALKIEEDALKELPYDLVGGLVAFLAHERGPGAILCFLPGWEEIVAVNKLLLTHQGHSRVRLDIHLVHSTSPVSSADAIFAPPPPGHRKVILATNIAESSVTIPDVVYVVDSGKQKIMSYDQRHRMNMLEACWVSRANVRQRLGRAGRCQAGEYWTLLSKRRVVEALPEQTPPEILRLGLEEVCLSVKALGLRDRCHAVLSTALDPPDKAAVKQAVERLTTLGAIQLDDEALTPLGRLLSNIPVHPAFGRMLILAAIFKCFDPILSIVASLGERLFRPARLPEEKAALQALFQTHCPNLHSDHLFAHRLYSEWKADPTLGRFRTPSAGRGAISATQMISFGALKRVDDLRSNLANLVTENLPPLLRPDGPDSIPADDGSQHAQNEELLRTIIAAGFYPDIAVYKEKRNQYQLRKIRATKVPVSSCNHEPGPDLSRLMLEHHRIHAKKASAGASNKRPAFFVYEDLLDIGVKMIVRTTAVDPMILAVLGHQLNVLSPPQKPDSNQPRPSVLAVDSWLNLHGESDTDDSDLRLLAEARIHLAAYLQWNIAKRMSRLPLSHQEVEAMEAFEKAFLALISQSTISRLRYIAG